MFFFKRMNIYIYNVFLIYICFVMFFFSNYVRLFIDELRVKFKKKIIYEDN